MRSISEIYWLAGLLEGEGCFDESHYQYSPGQRRVQPKQILLFPDATAPPNVNNLRHYFSARVQLCMTDRDVVQRAAAILSNGPLKIHTYKDKTNQHWKKTFRVAVHGPLAIGWLMTLYPLMGERRQAKIRIILLRWREAPMPANCQHRYMTETQRQRAIIKRRRNHAISDYLRRVTNPQRYLYLKNQAQRRRRSTKK
jgi:hypothetical protein